MKRDKIPCTLKLSEHLPGFSLTAIRDVFVMVP